MSCLSKCPQGHDCVEKCNSKHVPGQATYKALNECSSTCGACGGPTGPNKAVYDPTTNANYNTFTYCTLIAP